MTTNILDDFDTAYECYDQVHAPPARLSNHTYSQCSITNWIDDQKQARHWPDEADRPNFVIGQQQATTALLHFLYNNSFPIACKPDRYGPNSSVGRVEWFQLATADNDIPAAQTTAMPDPTPQVVELTRTGSGPARSSPRIWDDIVPWLPMVAVFVVFVVLGAGSKLGQIVSELKSIAEEVKALRQAVQALELGTKVGP